MPNFARGKVAGLQGEMRRAYEASGDAWEVFNPDSNRHQVPLTAGGPGEALRAALWDLCEKNEVVARATVGLTVAEDAAVVLCSRPGSLLQMAHCDWRPCQYMKEGGPAPLGLLVGGGPHSSLDVWLGSHKIMRDACNGVAPARALMRQTVHLGEGGAVLFSGYLVHAGSAYKDWDYRCHVYFDKPELGRVRNRTYIVGAGSSFLDIAVERELRAKLQGNAGADAWEAKHGLLTGTGGSDIDDDEDLLDWDTVSAPD